MPLSIRTWKERRAPWHALVFWVWLAGFAGSFAASDLFHAANCPERLLLQWAGHRAAPSAISPATPSFHLDIECAACLLQLDASAVFIILAPPFWVLSATICFARFGRLGASSHSLAAIARGPPRLARFSPLF